MNLTTQEKEQLKKDWVKFFEDKTTIHDNETGLDFVWEKTAFKFLLEKVAAAKEETILELLGKPDGIDGQVGYTVIDVLTNDDYCGGFKAVEIADKVKAKLREQVAQGKGEE